MLENIQCNLGNLFFSQNPQLKDIIAILDDSDQTQGKTQTEIDTNEFQSHNGLQSDNSRDLSVNESHNRDLSTERSTPAEGVKDTATDTLTETPDTVVGVITRSQARKRGELDQSIMTDNETALQEADGAESGTITPSAVDHSQFDETARQLGQIDLTDIDEHDNDQQQVSAAASQFQEAQADDPTLSSLWVRARRGSAQYRIIDRLLYKVTPSNVNSTYEYLLVVPKPYREELIKMAHNHPVGGHICLLVLGRLTNDYQPCTIFLRCVQ